ncbi:23S rRNA (uracil(1939)-C(5))-methyltransferase RlmD [Microbulbifer agarilyticus]|uniref:23S rRNA (uracil(1939)-C(5))-methyltransferase RlmD n=1 Tax=Microbulbifer agarilyticus TaxID=260552 RepID=UPI001C971D5F|nr:23S rRNA (uracil(1939)-C(5))-methyltransferase RlmD [Microbulbifer agarilyticus]MBY6190366.1 23S rRNA (uracil(1939)-C(5))-methyltransferase RlmD [Microbulbifer agarilyticus]
MPSRKPPSIFRNSTRRNAGKPPQGGSKKPSKATPEVEIERFSHEVRGIARHQGKTVFVDNALPGETVRIRYTANRAKFDEAVATEVLIASPDRQTPPCPHAEVCGGCALQQMTPAAQIDAKQQILLDQLSRFAKATPEQVLPPLTGSTLGYRRKARLGVRFVKPKSGGKASLVLGFREKGSNDLTDVEQCPVLPAEASALIPQLRETILQCEGRRNISHIEIAAGEDHTALVIRHLQPLSEEDRERWLGFAKQHQLHLYLQGEQGDANTHKVCPESGPARLHYVLPAFDLTLNFHPQDFIQVNFEINRQMVSLALELLDVQQEDRVLDLFCGLGNFTLPLATRAREVVGVEGLFSLTERARENASANGIDNVRFQAADLTEDFSRSPWARGGFDRILLDPPRNGALEVVRNIGQFNAKAILYISCNPATLARDTAELIQQGYVLRKAGVMDMFPHTTHVESIALFEKA